MLFDARLFHRFSLKDEEESRLLNRWSRGMYCGSCMHDNSLPSRCRPVDLVLHRFMANR